MAPRIKIAIRPGATPTCSGGGMDWYIYAKPNGHALTFSGHNPAAYVIFHQQRPDSLLKGWRGSVGYSVVDDDNDPQPGRHPNSRERIQARVELLLQDEGYAVLDRPVWAKETDEDPEIWSLKGVVDEDTDAGWEARAVYFPGTRSRRGGVPPHWQAEATVRLDGPEELELKDHTEHPSARAAQDAAEQLLRGFLEKCLAVLPLRPK